MTVRLIARCIRGLEWVVAAELEQRLGATVERVDHRQVEVVAPTLDPASPPRTADDLFATAGEVHDIGRHRAALALLTEGVAEFDLVGARTVAASVRRHAATDDPFEVVASFLGRRNFNRTEVEDAVGLGVERATGWRYASRVGDARPEAAWTLRTHIDGDRATVGIRCWEQPLHRRAYKEGSQVGTLHPPVAAAMALLSGAAPSQVVIDPCCGAGTIPIEAALLVPDVVAAGSDIDPQHVGAATANARRAGVPVPFVAADLGRSPFRAGSIDVVLSNLPWDAAVPVRGTLASPTAARDAALALRGGAGRAVLLVDGDVAAAGEPAVLTLPLSLFGRHPVLTVFDNGGAPFAGDPAWQAALARAQARYG